MALSTTSRKPSCTTTSSTRHNNSPPKACPCDEAEQQEKRQDIDSVMRPSDETMTRTSPRPPMAVLKLRPTNLFPEDESKPTKPIKIRYSPSEKLPSSRSIASSMFLVSPLRPYARQRPPSSARDLKRSLIDSSQTILRPLTPPSKTHRPKRSLSDANLVEHDNYEDEEPSQASQSAQQSTKSKQQQQRWLIPAEHPYKLLWDALTFILSFANVYATHASIRDRQYGNSWFLTFCEAWFVLDILLNFITEYRSDSYALRDCRSVWARYLTTWFVVDVLSLFPGEALYLRPLIDQQNKRGILKKTFFRSKAVVRVTRILRGRHVKLFGNAAAKTKHVGVGANRLLRLLIKYIPKYWMFFRNMKGVVALRMLRQVHWFRKVWRNLRGLEDNNPPVPKLRPDYDEDEDGAPF